MVWQNSPGPLYMYTQTLSPSIIPRGIEDWADAEVAISSTAVPVRSSFFILVSELSETARGADERTLEIPKDCTLEYRGHR